MNWELLEFVVFLFAMKFQINSDFKPTGDQPEAIRQLVKGLESRDRFQTLMGVTGSGKTFTVANVIEKVQRPTLVLAHNKTLSNTLFLTTTIISQRLISQQREPISKRTCRSMKKSKSSDWVRLLLYFQVVGMYWSLHLSLAYMESEIRLNFEKMSSELKWGSLLRELHFYIDSCKVFMPERLPISYMELFVSKEML